jgi:hypothetical protein
MNSEPEKIVIEEDDESFEITAGSDEDERRQEALYNDLMEDIKWYWGEMDEKVKAGNEENDRIKKELDDKLMEDIKWYLAMLKKK